MRYTRQRAYVGGYPDLADPTTSGPHVNRLVHHGHVDVTHRNDTVTLRARRKFLRAIG